MSATIVSLPTPTATSGINYVRYHGKVIRLHGNIWRVTAVSLCGRQLAEVECTFGKDKGKRVNMLESRIPLSKEIRSMIAQGLVS